MWQIDWSALFSNLGIILLTLLFFLLTLGFIFLEFNKKHITDNWVQYRCKPYVIPFASFFGKDVEKNFQYCMMHSNKSLLGYVLEPFHYMFSLVTSVTGDLGKGIDDLRSMSSSIRGGFTGIVGGIFNKVTNVTSEVIVLFTRIRDIMARLIGTFVVLVNTTSSAVSTGESIMNGPIGQVINYLCFDEDTIINLLDETLTPKRIVDIKIGDKLEDGSIVTSLLKFTAKNSKMYDIKGVIVSGNHLFLDPSDNIWKRVDQSKSANHIICTRQYIYCLNTDTHKIPISGMVFRDFEETDNEEIIKEIQQLIHIDNHNRYENNSTSDSVTGSYETGFTKNTQVVLHDNRTVNIDKVKIGDVLKGNNIVLGIIKHKYDNEPVVKLGDMYMLKDTLIKTRIHYDFIRPRNIIKKSHVINEDYMYQLITEQGTFVISYEDHFMIVADDNETTSEYINNYRENLILNYLNKEE